MLISVAEREGKKHCRNHSQVVYVALLLPVPLHKVSNLPGKLHVKATYYNDFTMSFFVDMSTLQDKLGKDIRIVPTSHMGNQTRVICATYLARTRMWLLITYAARAGATQTYGFDLCRKLGEAAEPINVMWFCVL